MISISKQTACANGVIGTVLTEACNCGSDTGPLCAIGKICKSDNTCVNKCSGDGNQEEACGCEKSGETPSIDYCVAGQICAAATGCSDPTDCTDATQTDKYCLCKKDETTKNICKAGQTCAVATGSCSDPADACTDATQTDKYCVCKKTGDSTIKDICEAGQTCAVATGSCSDPTDACTDAKQTDKYCVCKKTGDSIIKEICDPGQTCSTTNGNCTNPASCTEGGNAQTSAFCLCGTKDICKKDQICYIDDETQKCEDVTTCGTGNSPTTKQCTCSNTTCLDGQLCVINGTEGECKNITDCEEGGNAQSALCKCSDNIYCQKGEVCSKGKCNAVTSCVEQSGNNETEVQCTCGSAICKAGEKCISNENKCESENTSSSTLNRIFKIMLICTLVALF